MTVPRPHADTRAADVLVYFDRTGTTGDVWYYEQPLPEGRKKYSKTSPLLFEEFATCIEWWKHREENEQAWRVPAAKLLEQGCNLDISNPRAGAARPVEAPSVLIAQAIDHERRAMDALERIAHQLKLGGAA